MTAVLTRNPAADESIVDPLKDDGSRYRFEMLCERGRTRAYADSIPELLGVLIPGYEDLPEQERIGARVRYATGLLAPLQAGMLSGVDQSALSEEDRAVLMQPRFEAVQVDRWDNEAPLVLLDVHYAPFSDIPAPVSGIEDVRDPRNMVWLRAAEEFDLLLSLHQAGVISLGESNDFLV